MPELEVHANRGDPVNPCCRDDHSNTVVATVYPSVSGAPRPMARRRRRAGVLAPGSSLPSSFPRSPSVDPQTFARRLQLRGQPRCHTAFRFKSLAGTLRVARMIRRHVPGSNLSTMGSGGMATSVCRGSSGISCKVNVISSGAGDRLPSCLAPRPALSSEDPLFRFRMRSVGDATTTYHPVITRPARLLSIQDAIALSSLPATGLR